MKATPQPDPGREYEAQIAASIRARASARNLKAEQIADALGVSIESARRRLNGRSPWTLADLGRVAPVFGVAPYDLAYPVAL